MVPPGTGDGVAGELQDLAALADRLEHARFTIAFRGFEPREVHSLLAEAAALIRALVEGSDEANAALDDATRTRRVATAHDEATEIVRAAREEAERILDDAMRQAVALRKEAAEFREQARASVLEGIRDANLLMQRAWGERSSPSPNAPETPNSPSSTTSPSSSDAPPDTGGSRQHPPPNPTRPPG